MPDPVPAAGASGPGHLFVVRGDLTKLACDAWLVPTDSALRIEHPWRDAIRDRKPRRPDGWGDTVRVAPLPQIAGEPHAWLADVASTDPGWHVARACEFVGRAAADLRGSPAVHGRARHLIALPVLGAGRGGVADVVGRLVPPLVSALQREAVESGVDVVLVTWTSAAFAAAQAVRRRLGSAPSPALTSHLLERAGALASDAREGRLVLFLGAGVSMGAGLPGWAELLSRLTAGTPLEEHVEQLAKRDPLDAATLVEMASGGTIGPRIQEILTASRHSLAHALLAGLPVKEAVTTNFDDLYEMAIRGAQRKVAVLPHESATEKDGWLLKLHGSSGKGGLVLTRSDYLEFARTRSALAGIVQAMLATRHMMFVGFSLTDPDFHRILHDVRSAFRPPAGERFATSLQLTTEPLLEKLWGKDLEIVPMGTGAIPEAARTLDVFLDRLSLEATTGREHLLDPSYAGALDDDERQVADALRTMVRTAPVAVRNSMAWEPVAALLRALGKKDGGSS